MLLFSTIVFSFIFWRAIWPLKCSWYWKSAGGVLLFLAAFKFKIFHLFGGPMYFAPVLPRWLLFIGTVMFSIVFTAFFLLLVAEIIRLIWFLSIKFRKGKAALRQDKYRDRINLGILAAAIIFSVAGLWCGASGPRVKYFAPEIKNLPDEAKNLRIVMLCDIHVSPQSSENYVRDLVEKVNLLEPDVVVLCGDFVDGKVKTLGSRIAGLKNLKSKYGVYAVPGNHEYYSGWKEWEVFMQRECNVIWLNNRHVLLPHKIAIAGITDKAAKKKGGAMPDVAAAIKGLPRDVPVILLSHRPESARETAKFSNIALQLSGHTHGGMIVGFDLLVGAANSGYSSGEYKVGSNLKLYVSNGTGIWQGFPMRLGRPAEITLIELK